MSDGPYLCYKELNPTTGVVGSVFFQAFHAPTERSEDYLCTITPSIINIYKVDETLVAKKKLYSLELLKYMKVFGKLQAVQNLSRGKAQESDLLIVALDSGKIVAFEYDIALNDIHEYPLFNLEENALGLGAGVNLSFDGRRIQPGPGFEPILKVDSDTSMISAIIGGEHLFFASLSSRDAKSSLSSNSTVAIENQSTSSYHKHFTITKMVRHFQQHIGFVGPILDVSFVSGYHRPTVAILHQQHYLPVGHAKRVLHTCAVSVFTVDLYSQTIALLWSKANLPHDCLQLLFIAGEAMESWITCISQNAILVMNENSIHALPTNSFASITVHPKVKIHPWNESKVGVELDASYWTAYGDRSKRESSIIGFLRDGSVVLVRLLFVLTGISDTLRMDCAIIGDSSTASTISILPTKHLLFTGSRNGKSLLYEIMYRKNESSAYRDQLEDARKWLSRCQAKEETKSKDADKGGALPVKMEHTDERVKHILGDYSDQDDNLLEDFALAEEIANEERALYGCTAIESDPSYSLPREHDWIITLVVQDYLFNFGPILHGGFTKTEDSFSHLRHVEWDRGNVTSNLRTNQTAASYITDRDCKDTLLLSSGLNQDGHLHKVVQGVGFSKVGNRNFLGANRLFTLALQENYSLVVISYENKSRLLNCLLDVPLSSISLQSLPDVKFQEFGEESSLIVTSATIFIGKLNDSDQVAEGEVIVQVIPLGVRLIKLPRSNIFGADNSPLQDMLLLEDIEIGGLGGRVGENILAADCCPGYLSLLSNFHRMFVLKYNQVDRELELSFIQQVDTTVVSPLKWIKSEVVSVSLYYGSLDLIDGVSTNTASKKRSKYDESSLTAVEKEELLLYGALIKDLDEKGDVIEVEEVSNTENVSNGNAFSGRDESSGAFLMIYEEEGFLSIVRLSDLICVLRTNLFSVQETKVINEVDKRNYENRSAIPDKLQFRYIIETRLVQLQYTVNEVTSCSHSKLCLFLLFHTGELVVYHALQRDGIIYGWYKVMTRIIHNKKFSHGKLLRGQSDGVLFMRNNSFETQNGGITSGNDLVSNYLETEDYLIRPSQSLHKIGLFHHLGQEAILISANDPKIYFLEKGCSVLMPVGFPETPYVNYGQCLLLPLPSVLEHQRVQASKTSALRCQSFVATLWYEFEDIDVFKNPGNIKHRAQRQATFGLYRLLPNQHFSLYDSLSVQSIEVKQTVHRVFEIAKLTDHRTEQALLDKKTYLLYTSKDVYQEFQPNFQSTLEENSEDVMYERYFPLLENFAMPDPAIAPHPLVKMKEFRISLMQSGRIVDSYLLSSNDLVIDVIPLYLSVEKTVSQPLSSNASSSSKVYERRVFILVSVLNKDVRGEDSQGNGKLLLLGLDYAMFEEDIEEENNTTDDTENESRLVNENTPGLDTSFDGEGSSAMDVGDDVPGRVSNGHQTTPAAKKDSLNKTQKDFLGSIQPKLKLLWTGPGPASVIYQMPSFPSNVANNMNSNYSNPQAWNTSPDSMNSTQMFSNYVIATVGSTLYIYKLNNNTMELDQVTFFFSQFYITSVTSVKNYIIMTDMFHSVSLLYFREEDFSLHLVSKDFDYRVLLKSDLILDGNKIGIITSDDRENIQCFQQNRRKLESLSGARLLCLSEFHIGSEVSCMLSHDLLLPEYQMKKVATNPAVHSGMNISSSSNLNSGLPPGGNAVPPPPPPPPRTRKGSTFQLQIYGTRLTKLSNFPAFNPVSTFNSPYQRRTSIILGSMDGLVGSLLPLEERMYKRLQLLQQILSMILPNSFSMNTTEFRYHLSAFRQKYPSFLTYLSNNSQNISNKRRILDGSILSRYLSLDCFMQDEIAQLIGVNSYVIRENLHELDYVTRYF